MDNDFLIECIENEAENTYYDFKKDIYNFSEIKCKEDFLKKIMVAIAIFFIENKFILLIYRQAIVK